MKVRSSTLLSSSLALALCLSAASPTSLRGAVGALDDFADLFPDETLATGTNLKVTRNELDQAYIYIKANKAAQGIVIPGAQRAALEAQLLEKLITTRLIMDRATKSEKREGESYKAQQLQLLEERLGSKVAMDRHIIASGVTADYFHNQLFEEGVVKAVVQREVKGNYLVPESEIREEYLKNQEAFTQPQSIRIRRIFIGAISPRSGAPLPEDSMAEKRALMEDLRRRALEGADFAKLATDYSEDPLTRQRGGEVIIAKGQTKPEFEIPAFQLRPGQVSEIMQIGAGLHLIKMLEHRAAKVRPLNEVEEVIRMTLEAKFIEQKLPAYLEKIKTEASVKILAQP